MLNKKISSLLLAAALVSSTGIPAWAEGSPQVLATVGKRAVTSEDLRQAVSSSPFYTQFNSLDADQQAVLRGDLLKRLVASQLLLEEAIALKLDQAPAFRKELEGYREGLLYQRYMQQLRKGIVLPANLRAALEGELRGDADALAAAKASYVSKQYRERARQLVSELRKKYHVKTWEERIVPGIAPDTLLLEGDDGVAVRYGDLVDTQKYPSMPDRLAIESELYKRGELELIVKAAEDSGIDVSRELETYREERLPALLLKEKSSEWLPDDAVVETYYREHPGYRKTAERWLAGQIVLKTRDQAESVKRRIQAGESLYRLAGELSIDPYGRSHNGDMGWLTEGRGRPEIEKVLQNLDNGQVSDIIETPLGFHIVTLRDRKPGETLSFGTVRERIAQDIVSVKRREYLLALQKKYGVKWQVVKAGGAGRSSEPGTGGS